MMSFRRSRFLARVRGGRKKGARRLVRIALLLLLLLILLDHRMRPIITSMVGAEAELTATGIINRAASEVLQREELRYSDLSSFVRGSDGKILSVEMDTARINLIQTELTRTAADALSEAESCAVGVPLGTLLGDAFLSGYGPEVTIRLVPAGSVQVTTESRFESAGVNQTLHQIVMKVDAGVSAVIPGYTTTIRIHSSFILAESVIVGDVPDAYAQIAAESGAAIP